MTGKAINSSVSYVGRLTFFAVLQGAAQKGPSWVCSGSPGDAPLAPACSAWGEDAQGNVRASGAEPTGSCGTTRGRAGKAHRRRREKMRGKGLNSESRNPLGAKSTEPGFC